MYVGLINVKDLTFRVQDLEADTAVATTTHGVEASSLVTDTGSALPRHRARCNRKPGNGTSIRGYFGATSALRFERVSLLPLDPKASLFTRKFARRLASFARKPISENAPSDTYGASIRH